MPGNTNQGFTSRPDGTTGESTPRMGTHRAQLSVGKEAEFRFRAFALKFEPI